MLLFYPAQAGWPSQDEERQFSLTALEVLKLSEVFIRAGNTTDAKVLLTRQPFINPALEVERLFLLGRAFAVDKNYDDAIKIFRLILNNHPKLARIRLELALCYIAKQSWSRADYHLRLAASGDIPEDAVRQVHALLYFVRQNKNWDVWLNAGLAPERNINNARGGEECVDTLFGRLCRDLPEPENVTGFRASAGGNYEVRVSKAWRVKNEADVLWLKYDKKEYDELTFNVASGPRYVFENGDVWLAATGARRFLGQDEYSQSWGSKLAVNYDFNRSWSMGLNTYYHRNIYDEYGDFLDGNVAGVQTRLTYYFDSSKSITLRGGAEKEDARDKRYANIKTNLGIGFACELPLGFNLYIEPSVLFTRYQEEQWYIKDYAFEEIRVKDATKRFLFSVSNRKLDFWGLTPTVMYSYTKKTSNAWQREYDKHSVSMYFSRLF